jgi:hypothetical protein
VRFWLSLDPDPLSPQNPSPTTRPFDCYRFGLKFRFLETDIEDAREKKIEESYTYFEEKKSISSLRLP